MDSDMVTMPTSYLLEKARTLDRLIAGFDGGIAEVPGWQIAAIAATAAAIVAEVDTWRSRHIAPR